VTEQQLQALGALPDRCSEPVSRTCLMCGTATTTVDEWSRNGGCCGICGNATHRDECMRCRAHCEGDRSSRACGALAAYRKTGRVAFPEKIAEATKREADANRQKKRQKTDEREATDHKPPERSPPPPSPGSGEDGRLFADAWRRYWSSLGKYAVIDGRSNRADVLSFLLGQFAAFVATSLIGAGPFFLFATAIPTWALAVRRLHDANLSGKWLWLLVLWPIAMLVLPVMLLLPGTKGPNRFGTPPD